MSVQATQIDPSERSATNLNRKKMVKRRSPRAPLHLEDRPETLKAGPRHIRARQSDIQLAAVCLHGRVTEKILARSRALEVLKLRVA
jgi:hypothetical protein